MAVFGTKLPRPCATRLVVYVLGAGVGESCVVGFPDGRFMVMDACAGNGTNLTAALLEHVGASRVNLLVLSHPDLDHVRGMCELVERFEPEHVWRYPFGASPRDLIVALSRERGHSELADALEALDAHLSKHGRVTSAGYETRSWPPVSGDYVVRCLAPTDFDQNRAWKVWERLLKKRRGRLAARLGLVLAGKAKLGDAPNVVSLAAVVCWRSSRILLSGDVMRGTTSAFSGWKGILRLLQEEGEEALVTDLTAVKVAHHGSRHSFEPALWDRHAAGAQTIAAIAPFTPSRLPDDQTLLALRKYGSALLVSSGGSGRIENASAAGGWQVNRAHVIDDTDAPCLCIAVDEHGGVEWSVSRAALSCT